MGSLRSAVNAFYNNLMNVPSLVRYHGLKFINKHTYLRAMYDMMRGNGNTFDPVELHIYEEFLEDWWLKESDVKYLHTLNEIRIPQIYNAYCNSGQLIRSNLKPRKDLKDIKLLDVGCGGGLLTEGLAELGFNVTGIDPNIKMVVIASDHANKNHSLASRNINYEHTTIEDFSLYQTNYYDGIILSEVLDRVYYKNKFLKHCLKTLKPGGDIFITMKNRTRNSLIQILLGYFIRGFPVGTQNWLLFKSPENMEKMLNNHNCYVKTVIGLRFYSYTSFFTYSDDKEFWYYMHAIKKEK